MRLTTVIMQPTYLPWMGYFDLMDQADNFVFLDSVQFDKRSWQQRNRIKGPSGELMLTVPVLSKGRFDQHIRDVEIDEKNSFKEDHLKAIKYNYAKAKYFSQYMAGLEAVLAKKHRLLADLNIDIILWVKEALKIKARTLRSSALTVQGAKADLLVDICKAVGTNCYLSPAGAKVYLEGTDIFAKQGMTLTFQEYQPPVYPQLFGEFIPYLSVIDLLFNAGPDSLGIIKSGRVRKV